jgi:hypothetical protein
MSITISGEFKRQVDANAARLVESYRILLKKAQVGNSLEPQDELLISTAISNITFHAHSFLDQINEMRMHLLLLMDIRQGLASDMSQTFKETKNINNNKL